MLGPEGLHGMFDGPPPRRFHHDSPAEPERNLGRDLVSRLSSMRWVAGPTGAGRSFLACAFATEACLRGITTRYLRATRLFAMLREA